jgi:hypothetical protein
MVSGQADGHKSGIFESTMASPLRGLTMPPVKTPNPSTHVCKLIEELGPQSIG